MVMNCRTLKLTEVTRRVFDFKPESQTYSRPKPRARHGNSRKNFGNGSEAVFGPGGLNVPRHPMKAKRAITKESGDRQRQGRPAPPVRYGPIPPGDAAPALGAQPFLPGDGKPGAGDAARLNRGVSLSKSGVPPAVGDVAPVIGDANPVVGDVAPVIGDATPAIGDVAPVVGGATPAVGDASPVARFASPAVGFATPVAGFASPAAGFASPAAGFASPAAGATSLAPKLSSHLAENQPVP